MRNKPLVTVTFLSSLSGLPGRGLLQDCAPGRSLAVKLPTPFRAGLQPDRSSWQTGALGPCPAPGSPRPGSGPVCARGGRGESPRVKFCRILPTTEAGLGGGGRAGKQPPGCSTLPGRGAAGDRGADTSPRVPALGARPALNALPSQWIPTSALVSQPPPPPPISLRSHLSDEEEQARSRRHWSRALSARAPGGVAPRGTPPTSCVPRPPPACPSARVWESLRGLRGPCAPGHRAVPLAQSTSRRERGGHWGCPGGGCPHHALRTSTSPSPPAMAR